jgi:glutathione-specific gamma-glutamylcyclotransferase
MTADAFVHHPELRGLIADPDGSAMRGFDPQALSDARPDLGLTAFLTPPELREASRREVLAEVEGDLWVFAYGSLMWDPAFRFADVRRARVASHARRFILRDSFGGRGTAACPGLLAALDMGLGCDGLVFRIRAEDVMAETEILWRREMAGPAYVPTFVAAQTGLGQVSALAFVADPGSPAIVRDIPRDLQVRYIATGAGFFGTSLAYLTNIAAHFAAMGIRDDEVEGLVRETAAFVATRAGEGEEPVGRGGGAG